MDERELEHETEQHAQSTSFASLDILISRLRDGTFGEILADWKWIFSYSKKYKGAIVFYTLLGIFSTTLGLVSSVAGKYLIDIITGYQTDKLWFLILLMVGSTVFSIVFKSIISRITAKMQIDINNDIQADIFDKIVDADWMALNQYSNGDILNRFNGDIGTVSQNAIGWIPTIIIAVYHFIATFIIILRYDWVMALLAFVSAPFLFFSSHFIVRRQREYAKKVREMSSRMMTFEVETFYNLDTIKSFGIASHYGKQLRGWQRKFKDVNLRHNLFMIHTGIWLSALNTIVQFIAFGYCLYRLWTHDITYGTMTLFLRQRSSLSASFNSVVSIIPSFLNSSISAHRIRELVELPRDTHIPETVPAAQNPDARYSLRMRQVDFSYRPETPVILNSDFSADPGEIVALIGPSGEGKTTMIRLLLGLVRPERGHAELIAADGSAIQLNAETRCLFSYVPQGNSMLSGTIAENLRMVKPDATDEEVVAALQTACAWEFVQKLPNTINAPLGERGRGLSEGQAQRVAIARAVLRDAPILLLDEATSALDVTTERNVLRNIVERCPNKICILTTHRPSVLNLCRRVYRVVDTRVTQLSEAEAAKMAIDF